MGRERPWRVRDLTAWRCFSPTTSLLDGPTLGSQRYTLSRNLRPESQLLPLPRPLEVAASPAACTGGVVARPLPTSEWQHERVCVIEMQGILGRLGRWSSQSAHFN